MSTLEIGFCHRASNLNARAIVRIGDGHQGAVSIKRDHATQAQLVEDLHGLRQEVSELKVLVASELVLARLLQLHAMQLDAGLHQLLMYAHAVHPFGLFL